MKATHFRWIIILLLFCITVVNYIDRAALSFALPLLEKEFALNPIQMGYLLGAFGCGYIVSTLLGGLLVDRFRAHLLMIIAVFAWAIAMGWMGFAGGFISAFLARTLLGLAEGPNFPVLNRVVSDWLPRQEAMRALSGCLLAVPFALMIGGPLVTSLIGAFSWRSMFFILTLLSLGWLPFWWLLFRNFPSQSQRVNAAELAVIQHTQTPVTKPTPWHQVLRNKTLLANYWTFFVFGYFLFFFMGWLPDYLHKHYQLNLTQVGWFNVLPWLLGFIFLFAGGILADKIYLKTNNARYARSHFIWISQLLAGLMIIPIVLVNTLWLALLFISLAVAFILSANGAYYAAVIDVTKTRSGTAMGVADACFAIAGIIAPIMTGWLISVTHTFTMGFLLMSLLAFLSVIITLIWHHPEREILD